MDFDQRTRNEAPARNSAPTYGPNGILVVDDSPANALAIEVALGDLGKNVVHADSGAQALKCLLDRDFAVMLIDVRMPEMDGFQTARIIRQRERSRRTPIIFMTAYDRDDRDVREAYELGAVDLLFKPIVAEILQAKVKAFVDLQKRNAEMAKQAALLRQHERREHERALEEERRRWEEEALRGRMEEQQRANAQLRRKAEELALTIAERERVERELTRTNARLAEADRKKDDFLAVLSHELRTPLACLVTSLETLKHFVPESEVVNTRFTRASDVMGRQISHLVRLVDDLLDVSRIQSDAIQLDKERLQLSEILERAEGISRPEVSHRKHHLSVSVPDEPIWLNGDAVRLTQVVANLLINAARYTPPGGNIDLRASRSGSEVLLEVTDTGVGIAPDRLPDVFDLFVRHAPGDGLGVGLSLAKRLVEMHGGTISARSEGEGHGACFAIRLPAEQGDVGSAPRPTADSIDDIEAWIARRPHLRVVLVEDDPDIGLAVRDLLESWGLEVQVATTGREGLALMARTCPNVAILDIGLPDLDGYEVAHRIKRTASAPRLIAMSGYGRPEDRRRATDAGFDEVLVKPATALQLARALYGRHSSSIPPAPTGAVDANLYDN